MKPKTYHQLKMTEIAKQKKPNAPSKSEFMSDLTDLRSTLEESIMSSSLTSDLESAEKRQWRLQWKIFRGIFETSGLIS